MRIVWVLKGIQSPVQQVWHMYTWMQCLYCCCLCLEYAAFVKRQACAAIDTTWSWKFNTCSWLKWDGGKYVWYSFSFILARLNVPYILFTFRVTGIDDEREIQDIDGHFVSEIVHSARWSQLLQKFWMIFPNDANWSSNQGWFILNNFRIAELCNLPRTLKYDYGPSSFQLWFHNYLFMKTAGCMSVLWFWCFYFLRKWNWHLVRNFCVQLFWRKSGKNIVFYVHWRGMDNSHPTHVV
jgi:hypothetical protein